MSRTPITLITGFLGSGKTTLLRELLTDPALGETAVLVNELGEIALDHHLLSRIDERTVVLASGCVCCTIRADLADELRDLEARRARGEIPGYERVAIETTGLADPAPILSTLLTDPMVEAQYRIDAIVTTVDAVHGVSQLRGQPEAAKQAAVADRLLLTKTDLVEPQQVAELRRRLTQSCCATRCASARRCPLRTRAATCTSTRPTTTESAPSRCASSSRSTGRCSGSGCRCCWPRAARTCCASRDC
jgi:G3E family GTPase